MGIFGGCHRPAVPCCPFSSAWPSWRTAGISPGWPSSWTTFMHFLGPPRQVHHSLHPGLRLQRARVMATRILESPGRLVVSFLAVLVPLLGPLGDYLRPGGLRPGTYWGPGGLISSNLVVIALLGKVSTWILPEVSPGLLMEIRNTASPAGKTCPANPGTP